MTLNFLGLVNEVMDEIDEGQLTSSTFTTETSNEFRRVKNYINNAYREIFFERPDWSWSRLFTTLTTSAGTNSYNLHATADTESVFLVQINGEAPMEVLPYQEAFRRHSEFSTTVTGQPYVAYVFNSQLYLFPTPGGAYTVNYACKKIFSALSDYDDEPYLPEGKRHVLVYHAIWRARLHDNEPDADKFYNLYLKALQNLRNAEAQNHRGHSMIPEDETVYAEHDQIILLE